MSKWSSLFVGAALTLGTGGVTLAATHPANNPAKNSATNKQAVVHYEDGTVSSINNNELMLKHNYKGKTEDVKFMLNSNTKKQGDITSGERVRVDFKDQNNQRIATDIKPAPKPAAKSAAKSAPAKS